MFRATGIGLGDARGHRAEGLGPARVYQWRQAILGFQIRRCGAAMSNSPTLEGLERNANQGIYLKSGAIPRSFLQG